MLVLVHVMYGSTGQRTRPTLQLEASTLLLDPKISLARASIPSSLPVSQFFACFISLLGILSRENSLDIFFTGVICLD